MKQKIDKNPCPPGAYISVAKTNHKCVNKQMIENIMVRSAVGERIEKYKYAERWCVCIYMCVCVCVCIHIKVENNEFD